MSRPRPIPQVRQRDFPVKGSRESALPQTTVPVFVLPVVKTSGQLRVPELKAAIACASLTLLVPAERIEPSEKCQLRCNALSTFGGGDIWMIELLRETAATRA